MVSFGLSLYQFGQRRPAPVVADWPARPAGRLIWLIAPGPDEADAMVQLARLIREEDGHGVLLSVPPATTAPGGGVLVTTLPDDSAAGVAAWLDHWRPDAILFAGGELRPSLIHAAAARQIPMAMAEARPPRLHRTNTGATGWRNWGWYPGLTAASLTRIADILTIDEPAAQALRKAGAIGRISVAGRMEQPSAVLPANEAERAALAQQMDTRPVWLAAALPEAEEAAVIEAHRAGLRLAHRLLLIIVPEDPARGPELARRLETDEAWNIAQRNADEEPEAGIEVFIADAQELGLWYRLAPIAFIGGSLAGPGCLRNPMEAAALGASVIHGPRPGAFGTTIGRLGAAGAARPVASGRDLAEALSELLSPDRAARLARAAWGVASEGVEVTGRTLTLLRRMLGED